MADVLYLTKPDSKILHEFADEVESFIAEGRNVRGTITICLVDNEVTATACTNERVSTVLGALILAGQIIQEKYELKTES